MSYYCIFPNSTQLPFPLFPILGVLFSILLYIALYHFAFQKIIEKLFSFTSSFDHVQRIIIYLLIINFPVIALGASCLVYNYSLIGFYIGLDVDLFQCLLVSGYICYVEESRQTPLQGFLFLRDIIFMIGSLSCFINLFLKGKSELYYGLTLAGLYFVYYIVQVFSQKIETGILRLLQLKGNDNYNSTFLLTQAWKQADYVGLKETIDQNQSKINDSIGEFQQITTRVVSDYEEAMILMNFSKLFMPYKKCFEIMQEKRVEEFEKIIQAENQKQYNPEDYEMKVEKIECSERVNMFSLGQNESEGQVFDRNTLTDDFIIEENQLLKQQSRFDTFLKTAFYPIYLISLVSGRPRYFLDCLCLVLLTGCMWLLGNSCYYFAVQTQNNCFAFISFAVSALLIVPPAKYYMNISAYCDFDFINLFLQSSIIKSLIFGVIVTVMHIVKQDLQFATNIGITISVCLIILSYFVYACFMIALKFATLKTNYRFLVGLFVATYVARLGAELTLNLLI